MHDIHTILAALDLTETAQLSRSSIVTGDPAEKILALAEKSNAGLTVLGKREPRGFSRP